jgi:predicted RNA-binding Zn-ribbon protein involved in translation (DUF1610 family)
MISLELLTTIKCKSCNGQWIVKDAYKHNKPVFYCPHCGTQYIHDAVVGEMVHRFQQLMTEISFYYDIWMKK